MGKLKHIASPDNPRTRFYLVLGYLLWALLPHFQFIHHTHSGGAHFHATFAPSQIKQANQVLDALGPAALTDAATPEVGGEALPFLAVAGAAVLSAADAAADLHGHYWEDANLACLAALLSFLLLLAALLMPAMLRYQAPLFRFAGRLTARGPPGLRPA